VLKHNSQGPILGNYVLVCNEADKLLPISQLCADRTKQLILLNDKPYDSLQAARTAAEWLKAANPASGQSGNSIL
jgi:hypothetical protein